MLGVVARTNLAAFRKGLSEAHRKQVPFALATAVTDMAAAAKTDIQASMRTTFNQPKPYTLGAVFSTKASKTNLRAVVGLKDRGSGSGTPAWKFLAPEIQGGERNRKRFELRLGVPGYALPAPGAQLDASGDISRTQLGQIIAAIGTDGPPPATATISKKPKRPYKGAKGNRAAYFLAKTKQSGRPVAIYQVVGKGEVRPVLYFDQNAPTYTPRWRLSDVVLESLNRSRVGAFERAWAKALQTAR